MERCIKIFSCLALLMLAGCATQTFAPEVAPEYIVFRQKTPFFINGPLQGRGPDTLIDSEVRVKMLRKEMGYSLVQLEDMRTGYIANEDMAVAPPRPQAKPPKKEETYEGPQVNDIPLPDPEVPSPDLNIAPEEMPETSPTPEPSPEAPQT